MTKEIQNELIKLNVINYELKDICEIEEVYQCPIFKSRSDGCLGCKFRFPITKNKPVS
jgi:hypothetical protein